MWLLYSEGSHKRQSAAPTVCFVMLLQHAMRQSIEGQVRSSEGQLWVLLCLCFVSGLICAGRGTSVGLGGGQGQTTGVHCSSCEEF